MTRKERRALNRANATLSTGPATPEGKAASSQNATTHGLTSASTVLPTEDRADYNAFHANWLRELKPETFSERHFAQTVIDLQWRLDRIPGIEDKLTAQNLDALELIRALNNLSKHEARIRNAQQKAWTTLLNLQKVRRMMRAQHDLAASQDAVGFVLENTPAERLASQTGAQSGFVSQRSAGLAANRPEQTETLGV